MLSVTVVGPAGIHPGRIDIVSYSMIIAKMNKFLEDGKELYISGPIEEVGKLTDDTYTSTLKVPLHFRQGESEGWQEVQHAHRFNPDYEEIE